MPVPRPSPRASLVAGVLVAATLTACGGDPEPTPEPAAGTTSLAPAWNPCTGLDTAAVTAAFDTGFTVRRGTPDTPTCTFAPPSDGDPAVDVNYQAYIGSLTELLTTFGVEVEPGRTSVTTPTITGADDARVITVVDDDTLLMTGFVQNGRLVQIVNVLDPTPFDRPALTASLETLMAQVAANAESSGLTGS